MSDKYYIFNKEGFNEDVFKYLYNWGDDHVFTGVSLIVDRGHSVNYASKWCDEISEAEAMVLIL